MPPALNREVLIPVILDHIRKGCFVEEACEAAGVGKSTIYEWKKDDPELCGLLKQAQAEQLASMIASIKEAGRREWTATAWYLERRHPDKFAKRVFQPPAPKSEETGVLVDLPKPDEKRDEDTPASD